MDYKIVDNFTDPPGMTEHLYTEKLLRLPGSFLCYQPHEDSPEVAGLPSKASGCITFGFFNNFSKISPYLLQIWIAILNRVPNSHLLLKAKCFSDISIQTHIKDIFLKENISADRLELLSWTPSVRENLQLYNRIDICLDTFPYNGTTTTCDAMWMGVPVITLAGNTHVSRVGVSLLSNAGLTELIAKTPDEYIDAAVSLASDINKLQFFRNNLRDMIRQSILANPKQFTQNLENCYRHIWKELCISK